jgi:hypothetical protein
VVREAIWLVAGIRAWTPRFYPREREEARKFALKLTFKPFRTNFTHRPRVFRVEECCLKYIKVKLSNGVITRCIGKFPYCYCCSCPGEIR